MKDLFHGGEFHNMDLFLYMMHKSRLLKSPKLEDGPNRFLRRKKGLQFKKNDDIINKQRLHKICDEAGGCCSEKQVISAEYVRF